MVVRPAVLYGSECWPLKKTQVQRLMVVEMRMIRRMCGFTRVERIRNGVIRDFAKRRSVNAPVRRCEMIDIPEGKRGMGRPNKSLDEVIREDLKA